MNFLTDFADPAVILPLVLAIALALSMQRWWRGAFAWLLVTSATFGIVLALKLGFIACSPDHHPHSPSGHVAAATVVVGGLAVLLLRGRPSVLPVAILAATVVGFSRIALHVHSLADVVVGAIVGFAGAVALLWLAGPVPRSLNVWYTAAVAILVVLAMHGLHFQAEAHVRHLAYQVRHVIGC